jgi:hypothetical protein
MVPWAGRIAKEAAKSSTMVQVMVMMLLRRPSWVVSSDRPGSISVKALSSGNGANWNSSMAISLCH